MPRKRYKPEEIVAKLTAAKPQSDMAAVAAGHCNPATDHAGRRRLQSNRLHLRWRMLRRERWLEKVQ